MTTDGGQDPPVTGAGGGYVARFSAFRVWIRMFVGIVLLAVTVFSLTFFGVSSIAVWCWSIVALIAGLRFLATGWARLRRARRSGWIAIAVEMTGIRIGASTTGETRSFAWADVEALVLHREKTFYQDPKSRKPSYTHSIGVRLKAEAPGSPEDYERLLQAARDRTDLDEAEREIVESLKMFEDMDPTQDMSVAVSSSIQIVGWTLDDEAFSEALAMSAPDLPIIELSEDDDDPTDWLDDRDWLHDILEIADKRSADGEGFSGYTVAE